MFLNEAVEWTDSYCNTEQKTLLTQAELNIPGLKTFATHRIKDAIKPMPVHIHRDCFEFSLIVKGSMTYYTNDKSYDVFGGQVFISYPNEPHSTNERPITLNRQYWFQLDISCNEEILFLDSEHAKELINRLLMLNTHLVNIKDKAVEELVTNAFQLAANRGDRYHLASSLVLFLHELIRRADIKQQHRPDIIALATEYVNKHISQDIALSELAEINNMSTSQFKQKFSKLAGITPREFINRQKVELAKQLLATPMSITDIAMSLGFVTSSYFSAVFKKHTLKSPSEYRATITKQR